MVWLALLGHSFDNCLFYRKMPLLEEPDIDRLGERSGNGGQRIYQNLAKIKAPRPKLIIDKDSTELVIDLNSENN